MIFEIALIFFDFFFDFKKSLLTKVIYYKNHEYMLFKRQIFMIFIEDYFCKKGFLKIENF